MMKMDFPIELSNTENIPGKSIAEFHGIVSGSTVRAKHVGRDIMAGIKNIVGGELTVDKALNVLGAKYSAAVKNTVTQGEQIQPPNAPSTLARKMAKTRAGATNAARTLIDTGRMIGAVTWATFGSGR